ncbi:MAG: HAD family hydrolase [Bradymonadia bacterium]
MTDTVPQIEGFAEGAWQPEVYAALCDLVTQHGLYAEGYDPERPPLVVFDCDETLIAHDIGEALLRFMITRRRIHADRGFWNLIPERMGREAIRAAFNAVAGRADNEVKDTAAYRRYRAGLIGVYENIRANPEGPQAAYAFAARMLRGIHERTVADLVEEVVDHELDRSLGMEDIPAGPPFHHLSVPQGVRYYAEMLNLMQILDQHGFQVWVVSASCAPVVKALLGRVNLPPERVLGVELQTQSGVYTDRIIEPSPVGEGKLELFLDTVGRSPMLVVGDSINDAELMENCEGISIVVDRGDEALAAMAQENGWFIQGELTL